MEDFKFYETVSTVFIYQIKKKKKKNKYDSNNSAIQASKKLKSFPSSHEN